MNKKNTYSPKDIEMLCPECGTPIKKGSFICANCKLKIKIAKKTVKAKKAVELKPEKKEESAETQDKAKAKEIIEEEVEKEDVIKIVDDTETTKTDREEIIEAEEYFKLEEDTDKNN